MSGLNRVYERGMDPKDQIGKIKIGLESPKVFVCLFVCFVLFVLFCFVLFFFLLKIADLGFIWAVVTNSAKLERAWSSQKG